MAARIRRAVLTVALTLLMATALAGVAWAATRVGTNDMDLLVGTTNNDTLYGLDGPDDILAKDGKDRLYGGDDSDELQGNRGGDYIAGDQGPDDLYGGRGSDFLDAADGFREQDSVNCGPGLDRAVATRNDDVYDTCEIVNGERTKQ